MPWPALVALALVGAILLVLAMPVRLTVTARGAEDARRVRVRVHALLGLVDRELATARPRRKDAARPRAERSGGPRSARRAWALLHSRGVVHAARRLLERVWGALRVRELVGTARIGLEDPADTGALWAVMGPVAALLERRHPEFALTPSFAGEALDFEGRGSVVVVPLELVAIALAFALGPPILRAAVAAWRTG